MAKPTSRADSSTASAATEAVLGRGAALRGRVQGHGNVRVEGKLEGDVAIDGCFAVAQGGEVVADVQAGSLDVGGALEGDVTVSGAVVVRAGARVVGVVRGATVSVEEGASFSGRIEAEFDMPPELGGKAAR